MSNISHASLTGTQLHEPKGADSAVLGTVYVADGAGSGSWSSVGTSSFTGMIADFVSPLVPNGWLELDGSTISTSTFSSLYNTMVIPTSGTRANSSAVISSISDTSKFAVGYYVFGNGFTSGTTIVSIDSGTQITVSTTATSSGTSSLAVSPWLLNTGTIQLPNVSAAGRYRRSRTSSTAIGQLQASQNLAHTHTGTLTTSDENTGHSHNVSASGTTNTVPGGLGQFVLGSGSIGGLTAPGTSGNTVAATNGTFAGSSSAPGTASVSGTTTSLSNGHTHTVTIPSDGSTEARPLTLIVMTCVKT